MLTDHAASDYAQFMLAEPADIFISNPIVSRILCNKLWLAAIQDADLLAAL